MNKNTEELESAMRRMNILAFPFPPRHDYKGFRKVLLCVLAGDELIHNLHLWSNWCHTIDEIKNDLVLLSDEEQGNSDLDKNLKLCVNYWNDRFIRAMSHYCLLESINQKELEELKNKIYYDWRPKIEEKYPDIIKAFDKLISENFNEKSTS